MKRILIFLLIAMATMTANAQYRKGQRLVCTGSHVNVRTGPGKNYRVFMIKESCPICYGKGGRSCWYCKGNKAKYQLSKGFGNDSDGITYIEYLGKKRNGFLYVECGENVEGSGVTGWVSQDYLRPL